MVKGSHGNRRLFALLGVLFLSDCLLTFFWMGPWARSALFFGGIVLPLFLWAKADRHQGPGDDPVLRETAPSPAWLLPGILIGGIVLRCWGIETLSVWPTGDEGLKGMAGIGLSERWEGRFFYTVGQNPPFFIWLVGLFFEVFDRPLFDLWAPAALVSGLTLLAGWAAVRTFASRSFTLTFTALLAFSFWPLYLGRRCLPADLPPLGVCLLLLALIGFLRAPVRARTPWALGVGVAAGLQSFTYLSWPVVTLAGTIAFLLLGRGQEGWRMRWFPAFGVGMALGLLPFLLAVFQEGYGHHILGLTQGSGHFQYGGFLERCHRYLEVLLFRSPGAGGELGEAGGLLNPLLGPFFLLGLTQALRSLRRPFYPWVIGAFLLFLAPGILSLNLQAYRVVQVLPLLLGLTALGIGTLAGRLPRGGVAPVLVPLFILCAVSDWTRVTRPAREAAKDPWTLEDQGKSTTRYLAYQRWEGIAAQKGPGVLICEWDLQADRTLQVATRPFNAAWNQGLAPEKARWMGLLLDARYAPFVSKAFPGVEWKILGRQGPGHLLGEVGLEGPFRERALRWAGADRAFRNVNWAVDHVLDKDVLGRMDQAIREDHPLVAGDPLLESMYWEKVAEFYYYQGGRMQENLRALELAVARGVSAPHLRAKLEGLRALLQGRVDPTSSTGKPDSR